MFHCNLYLSLPPVAITMEKGCRGKEVCYNLVFLERRPQLTLAYREMQLFLLGYILIEICEIFTVGGIPLPKDVRIVRLI